MADLAAMAADPKVFRESILIDDGIDIAQFKPDRWQEKDFAALDRSWRSVAGHEVSGYRRAYLERPRGHSKTSDLAAQCTWALAFSPRRIRGIAAAKSREQARELRLAIRQLLFCNPWLAEILDVQNWVVKNVRNESMLQIISSDIGSSWGKTPDFIVVDELVHWTDEQFWISIFSSFAKRPQCLVVIITNAGFLGHWSYAVRENAREDDLWYFSRLEGPTASWITPESLKEQEKFLPPTAFQRLWMNQWSPQEGDALEEEHINDAIDEEPPISPNRKPKWCYSAGLDLGLKKHWAGFAVIGKNIKTGRQTLVHLKGWKPNPRVDLEAVEKEIIAAHKKYRFRLGYADPWQGEYLVERLAKKRIPFEVYPFSAPNMDAMARNLISQFAERNIVIPAHARLISQLRRINIVEKSSGNLKLEFAEDKEGHGDYAAGFTLGLQAANDMKAIGHIRPEIAVA